MDIIIPDIEHKYITLFETQQGYDAAAPNFIEVNWSAVKDTEHPEETPVPYQPSTRPTHGYEPVDNVDVFPDSSVRMLWYTYDHIYKTFFLEIIWGYSGWEWVDYEYTDPDTQETTTLHGGNLYKVKEITTVPSIPDGYRLEHINNFLNSQDKVTHICWFDTSNIKSMNNAFKKANTSGAAVDLYIDCYDFPNVSQASEAFANRNLHIIDNHTLYFGRVKAFGSTVNDANGTFYGVTLEPNVPMFKVNAPNLTSAHLALASLKFLTRTSLSINLNDVFIGDTLLNVATFTKMLRNMYNTISPQEATNISLDLTSSVVDNSVVMDFSGFLFGAFQDSHNINQNVSPTTPVYLDLNVNHHIKLDQAFSSRKSSTFLNIHNKENLIDSIYQGFAVSKFDTIPYNAPINNNVEDSELFYNSCFRNTFTYDFSPNNSLKLTNGHFTQCYFYAPVTFSHVDCLNEVRISYGDTGVTANEHFPYIIHDSNRTYADPRTQNYSTVWNHKRVTDEVVNAIDITKFRIVEITGSGIKSIAPQHIYSCYGYPFGSTSYIVFTPDVHLHLSHLRFAAPSSDTYYHFQDNVTLCTPTIHLHYSAPGTCNIEILGELIEDIDIYIEKEDTYTSTNSPRLYFRTLSIPSIINFRIHDNVNLVSNLNISTYQNLDMTVFEDTLNNFVYVSGYSSTFTLMQSQWSSLSTSCQNHCISVFNTINIIQEENNNA